MLSPFTRTKKNSSPFAHSVYTRITPRPFFRSRQVQSPCLERTSFEGTLALKGSEVGLYRPNGDPKVLGQFSDCRWISLAPEAILNRVEHPALLICERHGCWPPSAGESRNSLESILY